MTTRPPWSSRARSRKARPVARWRSATTRAPSALRRTRPPNRGAGRTSVIATTPAPATATQTKRLTSLDILRGAVMVLMAIDHVRVYSGEPAGGAAAGIFFTRWVTHFCAPVFVFLAGTGAFLHGRKLGNMTALSRYLVT